MKKIIFAFAAVAMLAACKSSKTVQEGVKNPAQVVAAQQVEAPQVKKNLSAKVDINLNMGGQSISVDGKLQLRPDDLIRLTITPFNIMEVGRLELTPEYVILINRMEKEYTKATYEELNAGSGYKFNFKMVQQALVSQTFIPGKAFDIPLNLESAGLGKINLHVTVGKVSEDASVEPRTEVKDRYTQVSVPELVAKLMNMK